MQKNLLEYKPTLLDDFREIEIFFIQMIGVEMIVKVYLAKIKEEIRILENPLIKGEKVRFAETEFQKIPILRGRFIVFFRMKSGTTKEIFHIKPAQTNYRFTIHQ